MLKRNLFARGSYCYVLKQWMNCTQVTLPTANLQVRHTSGLADQFSKVMSENIKTTFRTPETNPLKHDIHHEGLYYTVPQKMYDTYIQPGAHVGYQRLMKTFGENSIMVRQPALEIFDIIDNLNLDHPPLRILLYGKFGCGKSMTMGHVMHRCAEQDWVIVNVPWVGMWLKFTLKREISMSSYRPGRVDLTTEAITWLKLFHKQNEKHLANLQTTKEYIWTVKEKSEAGIPISELIDFGINRQKFASDCVGAILRELRIAASAKQIKVLVAVDGINGFWREARIKIEAQKHIPAGDLSMVHNFKKMFTSNWCNGLCIGIVDSQLKPMNLRDMDTPYYLLGKEGFEEMDPFLPVLVPEYSNKEVYSCLEYYINRMWIGKGEGVTQQERQELIALSNKNPGNLMRLSAQW